VTMMIPLFKTHELKDDASKGIEVNGKSLFAVRKNGEIYLYWNRCPHIGTPLDWEEDKFLDADNALIQCATHGALFEIDSGRCLVGPCRGKHLQPVAFELADGVVSVAEASLRGA
jgi:nitrite reductase/ring-hydroxylating ferredoxin subunit